METTRRSFLAGLLAASACPTPSWADVGSPAFLSAARRRDGAFALFGLAADGAHLFEIPLPARGHAAAAHPYQPIAVAFARRPGTFAVVIDCSTGHEIKRLRAPAGRHFYGHGVFSGDGALLFTTENDFENAVGRIGVWDVARGYQRVAEFSSGGVGPHDIKRMPDGQSLVIANGGIETHPDSGRTKLNIPTMRPNLSYVSLEGMVLDQVEHGAARRLASIRHLAVRGDGQVAVGCQWQGSLADEPLVYTHNRGADLTAVPLPQQSVDFRGYIGSIAYAADGQMIAATSPRGNVVLLHDLRTAVSSVVSQADVSGVAAAQDGLVLTTGEGLLLKGTWAGLSTVAVADVQWDNHLVALNT